MKCTSGYVRANFAITTSMNPELSQFFASTTSPSHSPSMLAAAAAAPAPASSPPPHAPLSPPPTPPPNRSSGRTSFRQVSKGGGGAAQREGILDLARRNVTTLRRFLVFGCSSSTPFLIPCLPQPPPPPSLSRATFIFFEGRATPPDTERLPQLSITSTSAATVADDALTASTGAEQEEHPPELPLTAGPGS